MLALLMRNQGLLGENPAGKNILANTVLSLTKIEFCFAKTKKFES